MRSSPDVLWFCHEQFKFSYRSSCDRDRIDGTADGREWRARPGERMILFPYAAIPAGHPYSESGPIFVHAEPCERYRATDEFPADFRAGRVMRNYNSNYDMIDAEVVNGSAPEAIIEKLLQKPETAFVDARSVTHGCYTCRIQRL